MSVSVYSSFPTRTYAPLPLARIARQNAFRRLHLANETSFSLLEHFLKGHSLPVEERVEIRMFAHHLLQALSQVSREAFSQEDLDAIFHFLIDLIRSERLPAPLAEPFARAFYKGFVHLQKIDPCFSLTLNLHLYALDLYENLASHPNERALNASLQKVVPYLLNHPDLPAEMQLDVFSSWMRANQNEKALLPYLPLFLSLPYSSPVLQERALGVLFQIFRQAKCPVLRKAFLHSLPFSPLAPHLHPQVLQKSISFVCDLLLDEKEHLSLRMLAAHRLALRVWTRPLPKASTPLFLDVMRCFKTCLMQAPLPLQKLVAKDGLFYFINKDPSDALQAPFVSLFFEVLESRGPIELKEELAQCMPSGHPGSYLHTSSLPFLVFMQKRITRSADPLSLKKIYLEQLCSCFLDEETACWIQQENPTLFNLDDWKSSLFLKEHPEFMVVIEEIEMMQSARRAESAILALIDESSP